MKGVDTIARIRREFFVRGKTIKEIVRELHVSRNTVRKVLRSGATEFTCEREVQPLPKLGGRADPRGSACQSSASTSTSFLTSPAQLRLAGVKLVISDAHEDIKAAVARVFRATWQRHF